MIPLEVSRDRAGKFDPQIVRGTRLNGWRVTSAVWVRPGDRVTFGSISYVVTDLATPAADRTAAPAAPADGLSR